MTTAPAPAEHPSKKWLVYGGLAGCFTIAVIGFVAAVAIVVVFAIRSGPATSEMEPRSVTASEPEPEPTPQPESAPGEAGLEITAIGRGDEEGNLLEQTPTLSTEDREIVAQVRFSRLQGAQAKLAALWASVEGEQVTVLAEPLEFDLEDRLSGETLSFWFRGEGLPAGEYLFAVVHVLPGGKYQPLVQRPFQVE
ncbi:MAG: hypothetical protein HY704_00245 [Gemmatimonadetes bacterium]|nr:hypothetical protein [Gemmatimonadota bacterium]